MIQNYKTTGSFSQKDEEEYNNIMKDKQDLLPFNSAGLLRF